MYVRKVEKENQSSFRKTATPSRSKNRKPPSDKPMFSFLPEKEECAVMHTTTDVNTFVAKR